jgi:hypothetical protein
MPSGEPPVAADAKPLMRVQPGGRRRAAALHQQQPAHQRLGAGQERRWSTVGPGCASWSAHRLSEGRTVLAADIAAYEHFLHDTLFKLPGITHVRSSIVLREVKAETRLPMQGGQR